MRIDERHLGEAKFPFAFQFGQQVSLAEQAFGAFVSQSDFGRSFGVDAEDEDGSPSSREAASA